MIDQQYWLPNVDIVVEPFRHTFEANALIYKAVGAGRHARRLDNKIISHTSKDALDDYAALDARRLDRLFQDGVIESKPEPQETTP